MTRFLPLLLVVAVGWIAAPAARGQDSFAGIDLLYPEFAHPVEDAEMAIKQRDYRFIATDAQKRVVPGLEKKYRYLRYRYRVRFLRQRFRLFASESQKFSYGLRARAYATDYNQTLVKFLLQQPPKK